MRNSTRRASVFAKKLVADVLGRVGLHDSGPQFAPTLAGTELTATERDARAVSSVDDVDL